MTTAPPSRLRWIAAAASLAAVMVLGLGACAGQSQPKVLPDPTTSVATSQTLDPNLTTVAVAKVPDLHVYADRPGAAPTTTTSTSLPRELAPIPRQGLNSAGATKTADGWTFSNPTYFGNPLTMVVTQSDGDWLRVEIPARPNQTEGWIRASDVTLSTHDYHMVLDLPTFTLTAYQGDQVIAQTKVVIGKDQTHTPVGRFYINEKIKQSNPGGAYGPWILSTNAYSESLDSFDGGLPVVAFHGTNQPQLIGTKASNGCIRLPNDVVTKLADTIPAGTPVDIRG